MTDPVQPPGGPKPDWRRGPARPAEPGSTSPAAVVFEDEDDLVRPAGPGRPPRPPREDRPHGPQPAAPTERPDRQVDRIDRAAAEAYNELTAEFWDKLSAEHPDDDERDYTQLSFDGKGRRLGRSKLEAIPVGLEDHQEARKAAERFLREDVGSIQVGLADVVAKFATAVPAGLKDKGVIRERGKHRGQRDRIVAFDDAIEKDTKRAVDAKERQAFTLVKNWALAQVTGTEDSVNGLSKRERIDQPIKDVLVGLTDPRIETWVDASERDLQMVREAILANRPESAKTGRLPRGIAEAVHRMEQAIKGGLKMRIEVIKKGGDLPPDADDPDAGGSKEADKVSNIEFIDINTPYDLERIRRIRPDIADKVLAQVETMIRSQYEKAATDLGVSYEDLTFFQRKDLLQTAVLQNGKAAMGRDKRPIPFSNRRDLALPGKDLAGVSFEGFVPTVQAKLNRLRSFEEVRDRKLNGVEQPMVELEYLHRSVELSWGTEVAKQISLRTVGLPLEHIRNMYLWFQEQADEVAPYDSKIEQRGPTEQLTSRKGTEAYNERMKEATKARRNQVAEAFGYLVEVPQPSGPPKKGVDTARIHQLSLTALEEAPLVGEYRENLNVVKRLLGPIFGRAFRENMAELPYAERAQITEALAKALNNVQWEMQGKRGNSAWKEAMGTHKKIGDALRAVPGQKDRAALTRKLQDIFLEQVKLAAPEVSGTPATPVEAPEPGAVVAEPEAGPKRPKLVINKEKLALVIAKIQADKKHGQKIEFQNEAGRPDSYVEDIFDGEPLSVEDSVNVLRNRLEAGAPAGGDVSVADAANTDALRAALSGGDRGRPTFEKQPLPAAQEAALRVRLDTLFPDPAADKPVMVELMKQFEVNRPADARIALRLLEQLTTVCERAARLFDKGDVNWIDAVNFVVPKADDPEAFVTETNNMRLLIERLIATPNLAQAGDIFKMTDAYADAAIPDNPAGKGLRAQLDKLDIPSALQHMVRGLLLTPVMDRPDMRPIGVLDRTLKFMGTSGTKAGIDLMREFKLLDRGEFSLARFVEIVTEANREK